MRTLKIERCGREIKIASGNGCRYGIIAPERGSPFWDLFLGESRTIKFVEQGEPAFWLSRGGGDFGPVYMTVDKPLVTKRGINYSCLLGDEDMASLGKNECRPVYFGPGQPLEYGAEQSTPEIEIEPGQRWLDEGYNWSRQYTVADAGEKWKAFYGVRIVRSSTKDALQSWLNENCTLQGEGGDA